MTTRGQAVAEERPPIQALAPEVAAQIAAGEVIERPASVVKELLENALDSGAGRISVDVRGDGIDELRVSDDGWGIPSGEVALAFGRHATSKLRTAADLESVRTYGFRGEALSSIAAAADVECLTRTAGSALGVRLCSSGGRPGAPEPAGAARGTAMIVRDLFGRQPARRKFLSGARSERGAIVRVCGEAALARPDVAISLRFDGRPALQSDGQGGRRAAAAAVWGREAAAAAIAFGGEDAAAGMRVEGLAGPPAQHRGRRDGIWLYVNGRPVQSRRLAYAVEEAYRELLPARRYPYAAVFLTVPGDAVDINVHPAKAEVKLREEGRAFALVQRAVRTALLEALSPGVLTPRPPEAGTALPPGAGRSAARALVGNGGAERAVQPALPGEAEPRPLPPLRVVGQTGQLFIVAEGPGGLYLVDQHAAHERVWYERLLAVAARSGAAAAAGARQALLEPVLLELTPLQAAAAAEWSAALTAQGFSIEPFGGSAVRLRAVPACLAERDARSAALAVLDDLSGSTEEAARFDRVAASTACHAAVRAGQTLAEAEMRAILRDLERCASPHTCPHGRPTLVHLPTADLERRFGRR